VGVEGSGLRPFKSSPAGLDVRTVWILEEDLGHPERHPGPENIHFLRVLTRQQSVPAQTPHQRELGHLGLEMEDYVLISISVLEEIGIRTEVVTHFIAIFRPDT
jgi:hypothetical protein